MFTKEAESILKQALPKNKFVFEKPPKGMGDLACTIAFDLAKLEKKNPALIAKDIVSKIKIPEDSIFESVKAIGPYINFYYKKDKFSQAVIKEILKRKSAYGKDPIKKEKMLIEYYQVNTHKPVHIGHSRGLFIGESMARLAEFNGYKVIRLNYGGDIGPHVAKCLWGCLKLGLKPGDDKGRWLGELYAKASQAVKDNESLKRDVVEITTKLYNQDPALTKLWKETRQWSIEHSRKVAELTGTKFDKWLWESEVEKEGLALAKKLVTKGILKLSQGAIIADLNKYKLGVLVLVTKEGNPLYGAKDLGSAKAEFSLANNVIHVVGVEQSLYFKQLFKILELSGIKKKKDSVSHLVFELIDLKEGKMSSRTGNVVLFMDLYDKMFNIALDELRKRGATDNIETRAHEITISAMKFGVLKYDLNKKILFDINEWLSFEGETGPYIQYSNARANRILEKAGEFKNEARITDDFEYELIKQLSEFPAMTRQALKNQNPPLIAHYAYALADSFSKFYEHCPVIKSDYKDSRLTLVKAYTIVMSSVIKLLGLKPMIIM